MNTFTIEEAKSQLAELVERARNGEPLIIAEAGKAPVKIVAVQPLATASGVRLGFMTGEFTVPDDFNQMEAPEIEALFYGRK
jgi:prevent-host-death family protein